MRILVTGSNGLLGQKLTKLLQEDENVYLIATARGKSALRIVRGEYHSLDITNREAVESLLRFTKPDVIINRFSTDTSRPNHGHHTASAILALEAFDLAGKNSEFPEDR